MGDRTGKVYPLARLAAVRRRLGQKGQTVVFTNGCFDLLHAGHVRLFHEAKRLGDALIVALNSDRSVRRLKGPTRPVFPLPERFEILAALTDIDYLTSFDQATPQKAVAALKPDVLVKGGDWGPLEIIGRAEVEAAGGRVVRVPYYKGHSTSAVIRKIARSQAGPKKKPVSPSHRGTENGPFGPDEQF
jgi:D-beta-D-heptose 7-phosphate kinase/D-beta-D-heptose 1-phosphate adenosyltransferase